MFFLLVLISLIAWMFSLTDRIYFRDNAAGGRYQSAVIMAGCLLLYGLTSLFPAPMVLLSAGLILLFFSFIILNIIPSRQTAWIYALKTHSYWSYGASLSIIWAISGLPYRQTAIAVVLFIAVLFIISRYTPIKKETYSENVKKILELFHLIGGIFQFVVVLIIATDRVRFLEKIARYLFE